MSSHMARKYARNYRKRKSEQKREECKKPKKSGAERMRELRQRRKKIEKQMQSEYLASPSVTVNDNIFMKAPKTESLNDSYNTHRTKQEPIDSDDIHGSCTWSSFGPSESHSTADALSTTEGHSTTEGSYSRTIISTENTEPDPQNTYNADAVKPEPPRDSWSFYEVTEIGIKDQIQQNEDIKYQEIDNKHLVFAASIAERLKTCNRDKSEIEAAKRAIDSILENLAMGAHSSVSFSESKVPEDVFIKQEVDQ